MNMNTSIPLSPEKTGSNNKSYLPDQIMLIGYLLLTFSTALFVLCEYFDSGNGDKDFGVFICHYFLAIAYGVILIYNYAFGFFKSWQKENLNKTIILLNLFLISAYALNRELPVFEDSTDWLCGYLIITSLVLLSYQFVDVLPRWIKFLQQLLLGSAILLYSYLTLFVSPFYPIGCMGMLAFGIGGHIFVPASLVLACYFLVIYNFPKNSINYIGLTAGFIGTILCAVGFVVTWNKRISKIEVVANQAVLFNNAALPVWVNVSQSILNDWITQRILKSDLVYTTRKDKFNDWSFMPETVSWDEKRKHDPLVFLASLNAECTLAKEDRVKILRATSDLRHRSNERLWSGDNLVTSYIVSDIDIYPDLRLAYTEKYLNIKNNANNKGWRGNSEEAIYTFQLPEGSVVTSLSLWINGIEEKGILTSKQKATKAYKTIVRVERRDPSVVHWQEGNTVTVRIFPCTSAEERRFKIGITSPLVEDNGQIIYKNITFLGPSPNEAKETIRVRFIGSSAKVKMPGNFSEDKTGDYISESEYEPEFEISMPTVALKTNNNFTFDGFRYSLTKYEPLYQPFVINQIYLDINQSWTSDELTYLKSLINEKDIFVYNNDTFIKLNNDNWDLTDRLKERCFSLFPFHQLKETQHALVITKGKPLSPHLVDFKDSKFAAGITNFFAAGKKVHVYNLEAKTSTYINSLRELRAFEFAEGNTEQLGLLLNDKKFPSVVETENTLVLHDSKMMVTRTKWNDSSAVSNAPDHLARLYAYNDIMRKIGVDYLKNDFINEQLVDEATTAYVVSPVSSLIVLETQEDYKRFDINDKENSLHNASKQSSGAVPEPHEWVLIIMFMLFVFYLKVKK